MVPDEHLPRGEFRLWPLKDHSEATVAKIGAVVWARSAVMVTVPACQHFFPPALFAGPLS